MNFMKIHAYAYMHTYTRIHIYILDVIFKNVSVFKIHKMYKYNLTTNFNVFVVRRFLFEINATWLIICSRANRGIFVISDTIFYVI